MGELVKFRISVACLIRGWKESEIKQNFTTIKSLKHFLSAL